MCVIDRRALLPIGADARPVVLVFPGLSLMDIEVVAGGQVIVRCPGCGASQLFALQADEEPLPPFQHQSTGCRIRQRIEAALAVDQAMTGSDPG